MSIITGAQTTNTSKRSTTVTNLETDTIPSSSKSSTKSAITKSSLGSTTMQINRRSTTPTEMSTIGTQVKSTSNITSSVFTGRTDKTRPTATTNNTTTTQSGTISSTTQTNGGSKTTLNPNDFKNTSYIITSIISNTPKNMNSATSPVFTTETDKTRPTATTNNTATTQQRRLSSTTQANGESKTTLNPNNLKNTSYIMTSSVYNTPTTSLAQQTNTTVNNNIPRRPVVPWYGYLLIALGVSIITPMLLCISCMIIKYNKCQGSVNFM
ncbi:uncharacterized protein LOC142659859 [Rhinoderma darwinii]|uniref:uncharacterized protein LOC142659859 n=1 Tax=Rhinoderma darwinii TaxID=43563 RepID=UPI003F672426